MLQKNRNLFGAEKKEYTMYLFILRKKNTCTKFFQLNMNKFYAFFKAFCLLKSIKLYIFFRKPEKILGFTSKFRYGWVTLNTGIFYLALMITLLIII